jgi:hypothetical protein
MELDGKIHHAQETNNANYYIIRKLDIAISVHITHDVRNIPFWVSLPPFQSLGLFAGGHLPMIWGQDNNAGNEMSI